LKEVIRYDTLEAKNGEFYRREREAAGSYLTSMGAVFRPKSDPWRME